MIAESVTTGWNDNTSVMFEIINDEEVKNLEITISARHNAGMKVNFVIFGVQAVDLDNLSNAILSMKAKL